MGFINPQAALFAHPLDGHLRTCVILNPVARHEPNAPQRRGVDGIDPRLARRWKRDFHSPVAAVADDAETQLRLAIAHPALAARPCIFRFALLHHRAPQRTALVEKGKRKGRCFF